MKILFKLLTDRDFLFFCGVGALSALANFGSFFIFWHVLEFHYEWAVSCSYVISICVHFLGNRHVTFRNKKEKFWPQFLRYLCMVVINYFVTLFVVFGVVHWVHLPPYVGVIASIGATVMVGFVMAKYWVFVGRKAEE